MDLKSMNWVGEGGGEHMLKNVSITFEIEI